MCVFRNEDNPATWNSKQRPCLWILRASCVYLNKTSYYSSLWLDLTLPKISVCLIIDMVVTACEGTILVKDSSAKRRLNSLTFQFNSLLLATCSCVLKSSFCLALGELSL